MINSFTSLVILSLLFSLVLSFTVTPITTPPNPHHMRRGTSGICFRPNDNNYVYICNAPVGGIYQVNKTSGYVVGYEVEPSDAPECDDCSWTPDGEFLTWTEILNGFVRAKNVSGNGAVYTIGPLPFANGISCFNNTLCYASDYPPVRGGILVQYNPRVAPAAGTNGLSITLDFESEGFSSGLNGFEFNPNGDGTLYGPISSNGEGSLNSVIKYNIFTKGTPVVISTGYTDTEGVRISKDGNSIYILEEARSEIYEIPINATVAYHQVLLGALRNPTYIDNFAVDAQSGNLYITDSTSAGLFFMNYQTGAWYPISTSDISSPFQIQVVNTPPVFTPLQLAFGSTNSFFQNNQIFVIEYYDLRNITAAGDDIVTANDEYGLDFPFGTTTLQVTGDYVYVGLSGGIQIRSRSLGISLVDSFFGSVANPYQMTQQLDGTIVLADYGAPESPAITYKNASGKGTYTISAVPATQSSLNFYSSYQSTEAVQRKDPPGTLLSTTTFPGKFNTIVGVVADPQTDDIVYFSDWQSSSLVEYNTTSQKTTVLMNSATPVAASSTNSASSGTTGLLSPSSLSVFVSSSHPVVLILDTGHGRIVGYNTNTHSAYVVQSGLNMGYLATFGPNGNIGSVVSGISNDATGQNIVFSSDVDNTIYYLN